MAKEPLGGLTPEDQKRLANLLRESESGLTRRRTPHQRKALPWQHNNGHIAKTGASPIVGRSGTTPGSDTVTVWIINTDGDLEETDIEVTAYNIATGDVAASTYIQIKLCDGKWVIDFEDCG